jgi:hypothetical protein
MDDPLAYVTNASVSLLEEVKLQAQVLVPLLKAFRAELGEERANQIMSAALRDWARNIFPDHRVRVWVILGHFRALGACK